MGPWRVFSPGSDSFKCSPPLNAHRGSQPQANTLLSSTHTPMMLLVWSVDTHTHTHNTPTHIHTSQRTHTQLPRRASASIPPVWWERGRPLTRLLPPLQPSDTPPSLDQKREESKPISGASDPCTPIYSAGETTRKLQMEVCDLLTVDLLT